MKHKSSHQSGSPAHCLLQYYFISIITHIASGLRVCFVLCVCCCCKNGIKCAVMSKIIKAEFQTVGALSMQNHAV